MPLIDFIGSSYSLRSVTADCQETINLIPCINEIGKSTSSNFLVGSPGLKKIFETFNSTINTQTRAMYVDAKDNFWIVSGFNVIKVEYDVENKTYLQKIVGTLYTENGRVSIAENAFELGIVDGDNYYIYNYKDTTFTPVTVEGWLGSNIISYYSSYFVFIKRDSFYFFISNPMDGTKLPITKFGAKEGYADNIVTCLPVGETIWMFGTKTTEIYTNTGSEKMPIERMSGALFNIGCVAKFSAIVVNNSPIWLGRDTNGVGTIYSGDGLQPKRISNFAVEYSIQNMKDTSNATAYSYQEDGHVFYVLNFPSANTTWVYDLTTGQWHERKYFNSKTGLFERARPEYHVFWNGIHIVSDHENNKIYEMNLDYYSDDGDAIYRLRRSPHYIGGDLKRVIYNRFELEMDIGDKYNLPNNREAKIRLRFSNDAGKTWSNYLNQDLWLQGQYKNRVIWRNLGQARNRVFEVSITDPVKVVILNAYAEVKQGIS